MKSTQEGWHSDGGDVRRALPWRKIVVALLIAAFLVTIGHRTGWGSRLSLTELARYGDELRAEALQRPLATAATVGVLFVATAFFLPGALALTVASGYLFGGWKGGLLSCCSATIGAALAFLAARYLAGRWLQQRFVHRLGRFNREVECNGVRYLLLLRMAPVFPAFMVNCLAGLTHMPLRLFIFTSFVGALPGSFIYAAAGTKLAGITSPRDLMNAGTLLPLLLALLCVLLPMLLRRRKRV